MVNNALFSQLTPLLAELLRRPGREAPKAAPREAPQRCRKASGLHPFPAPRAAPRGSVRPLRGAQRPARLGGGGPKLAGAAEVVPARRSGEAARPPLLTRTRLLTAACTADTGAVRSGIALPSTSPSSCMMTRWEICWATGSRMLSMVRVWKTGMAAAGREAGARSPHKLFAKSVPAGWRLTEKTAASAHGDK